MNEQGKDVENSLAIVQENSDSITKPSEIHPPRPERELDFLELRDTARFLLDHALLRLDAIPAYKEAKKKADSRYLDTVTFTHEGRDIKVTHANNQQIGGMDSFFLETLPEFTDPGDLEAKTKIELRLGDENPVESARKSTISYQDPDHFMPQKNGDHIWHGPLKNTEGVRDMIAEFIDGVKSSLTTTF